MTRKQIEMAALFFSDRVEGMPHIDTLFILDDLWRVTYEQNKTRSFAEGKIAANIEVLQAISESIT